MVQESLHPGCIGPHFSEEARTTPRRPPWRHSATASSRPLGCARAYRSTARARPGGPQPRVQRRRAMGTGAASRTDPRRPRPFRLPRSPTGAPPIADNRERVGACPRHGLLRAERGLRNLLRRRRTREAGKMKARQPHSVGGPKERADVVEAAHVVQKNFYDGPGPS